MSNQQIPEPLNAHEYWAIIDKHTPREHQTEVWDALNSQVKGELSRHKADSDGTQGVIQWIAKCDMPDSLGLVDGTEYDTLRAHVIKGLQNVLSKQGVEPAPLPPEAPVAGTWVRKGNLMWQEGGSNRASEKHHAQQSARHQEVGKLNSTSACKEALAEHYKDKPEAANPKAWKRGAKLTQGDITARVFTCGGIAATVFYDDEAASYGDSKDALIVHDGDLIPKPDPGTVSALKKAADSIVHCGDYGMLYYSPNKKEVVWVGGDADDFGGQHTGFDEIKSLLSVAGVEKVEIYDEHSPDLKEGFIFLGEHGKKGSIDELSGHGVSQAPGLGKSLKVR